MAKRKVTGKRSDAYTIDTPQVRELLNYLTSDIAFENPSEYNVNLYSQKIKTITSQQLYNYFKIEGFTDELTRRKEAYTAKEKLRIVKLARAGLETLAAGKAKRHIHTVNSFGVSDTVETLEPQRAACVDLLKLDGGYKEIEATSRLEIIIKNAAAKIDGDGK